MVPNKGFVAGDLVVLEEEVIENYIKIWGQDPKRFKTLEISRVSDYIPGSKKINLENYKGTPYLQSSDVVDIRKATEEEIKKYKINEMFKIK